MSIITKKKLEAVLNNGFDGPDFRKALDAVAEFYGKGEESNHDDGDISENNIADEPLFINNKKLEDDNYEINNTIEERRNLRENLQEQGLNNIKEFLEHFEPLKNRLENIYNTVQSLDDTCQNIEKQITHAEGTTAVFMKQSRKLQDEKEDLLKRQGLVDDFLTNYQLSREELQLLRHEPLRESDGGMKFFQTVEKLNRIRKNSSTLLGSVFQRASLET